MTGKQKRLVRLTACAALCCGMLPMAGAMYIMEGYLPPAMCIAWGAVALPFLAAGYFSLKKRLIFPPPRCGSGRFWRGR